MSCQYDSNIRYLCRCSTTVLCCTLQHCTLSLSASVQCTFALRSILILWFALHDQVAAFPHIFPHQNTGSSCQLNPVSKALRPSNWPSTTFVIWNFKNAWSLSSGYHTWYGMMLSCREKIAFSPYQNLLCNFVSGTRGTFLTNFSDFTVLFVYIIHLAARQ